jgi:hypothetical protein
MADDSTTSLGAANSGGDSSGRSATHDLSLTGPECHTESANWIRDNVVLKGEGEKPPVVQLNVELPQSQKVTLFMDTSNHYIVAFRGAEGKVVQLSDDNQETFEKKLLDSKLVNEKDLGPPLDLGADHNALGTFELRDNNSRQRDFGMVDLMSAGALNKYSPHDPKLYEIMRTSLSLLVCMLAESARHRLVLDDFQGIYRHERVTADRCIQSYDKACQISDLAERQFQSYLRRYGVEKVVKRCTEMREVWKHIKDTVDDNGNSKRMLQQILDGSSPHKNGPAAYHVERLRHMAKTELNISQAEQLTTLLAATERAPAIRSAAYGVSAPKK